MRTIALLALALATPLPLARSQSAPQVAGPVRDGGTFHVATNTWSRGTTHSLQTLLGADVLYDNTCASGYYMPLNGGRFVDEGRLPSPTAPAPTGCATAYRVDGFQFAYCTDQQNISFTHRFYQTYAPCTSVAGIEPTATVTLATVPSAPAPGTQACWFITIDLAGTAGGSFVMAADGDGTYGTGNDHFGWSVESTASGFLTGPLIAGNPNTCAVGGGTAFSPALGPGTGIGNMDQYYLEGSSSPAPGCYWFGGSPFAGFHLTLQGTACESFPAQVNYCAGDGSATACPCGNSSTPGADVGCFNTTGLGGKLRAFGTPSIANDSFVLLGSQMTNGTCLYFQGTTRENGGQGTVFGDGLRCASGTITRLATKRNGAGASQYPSLAEPSVSTVGGITTPGTRTYQAWYRNNAPFCTPAAFNLTNGVEVAWGA